MSLISYLTKIHFADDILEEALRAETQALRITRPLLIADASTLASGLIDRLFDCLGGEVAVVLFCQKGNNATESDAGLAAALYQGAGCDGFVAVGGGAAIDLAKAAAILVSHHGPLLSYAAMEGGIARIRNILPPVIAVPTAAGAGSEVGRSAAVVFEDGRKLELVSPFLIPRVAICDPTLTLGVPPQATAQLGMDALTHCIETFLASAYNPPADAIALDGAKRAAGNILRAVERGRDLDARREMMAAAMNGALAFQKGLGGAHAMSHALEGLKGFDLPHGTLNAILLPHVLEFNRPAVSHRFSLLREAVAAGPGLDLPDAVRAIGASIGLPSGLGQLGVDHAAISLAAPMAERDYTNSTNPRRASSEDYTALMRTAL